MRLVLALIAIQTVVAQGAVYDEKALDTRRDPRLSRTVQIEAASITLSELAKVIQKETRVVWRVPDRWRETRLTLYAPNCPLKEVMEGVTAALPVLEWRVREMPNRPIEYALQQTRSLKDASTPDRSEQVNQLRRQVELLRLYWNTPEKLAHRAADYTPSEHRAVKSLLNRLNTEPHDSTYYGLINKLVLPTGVEWLVELTEGDWRSLERQGVLTRRFTSETPAGAAAIESLRALAASLHQRGYDFFTRKAERWERTEALLGELRLNDGGELWIALARFDPWMREVGHEPWHSLLLSVGETHGSEALPPIPELPEWRTLLPPPPLSVQRQANWYNELGCLLLELAHVARRPLITPLFPFYARGDTPARVEVSANTLIALTQELRQPAQQLPRLLAYASLELKQHNDWLIGQHTQLGRAVAHDIPDSLLQQWFSDAPLSHSEWLRRLLDGLSSVGWSSRAMLLRRLSFGGIAPVYEHTARYPLPIAQIPALQWSFTSRYELQRSEPSGELRTISLCYQSYGLDALLSFWRALPPAWRHNALSGNSVALKELPAPAQAEFLRIFRNAEFLSALIGADAAHEARFRVEYRPAVVSCAVPNAETQRKLREADNPIAAWQHWYYEKLSMDEQEQVRQELLAPVWRIAFEWGEWRIEYRVQRAVCGAWLAK